MFSCLRPTVANLLSYNYASPNLIQNSHFLASGVFVSNIKFIDFLFPASNVLMATPTHSNTKISCGNFHVNNNNNNHNNNNHNNNRTNCFTPLCTCIEQNTPNNNNQLLGITYTIPACYNTLHSTYEFHDVLNKAKFIINLILNTNNKIL